MKYLLHKTRISLFILFAALCAVLAVSCSHHRAGENLTDSVAPNMIVRFIMQSTLSDSATDTDTSSGYEDGSVAENYIDINNGCRVLFFSVNNTFLGLLNHPTVAAISGTGYKQYSLFGTPPENLPADFRIMIAANWPDLSAVDNAVPGATTIDDICHNLISSFDFAPGTSLNIEGGRLIPLFGIREYTNIDIVPGTTMLPDAITMLRALAKVEVMFDSDSDEIPATVQLRGFNTRGYCAPAGVYSQNDYGQGNDWTNDYLHRLHLISADNNNESGAGQRVASLEPLKRDNGYCFTTYVPEYRNMSADGKPAPDEASIEIRLASQTHGEEPFRLYFAEYAGSSSTNTALPRYNIERNNIYRFGIKLHGGKLIITARPWNYRPQPEINA